MRGSHVLKTWSTTQATVALSSAEAELIALVKGAAAGLAVTRLLRDYRLAVMLSLLHIRRRRPPTLVLPTRSLYH